MKIKSIINRHVVSFFILVFLICSFFIIKSKADILTSREASPPYYVALTFDDGPYIIYTEKLLKLLQEKNVKATFFVIGRHVESSPDLAKLIISDGQEIAGHTYTHADLTKLTDQDVIKELEQTRNIIKEKTGVDTYLFRPPGGSYNSRVEKIITEKGYKMVLWSVLPRDYVVSVSKEAIVKKVLDGTKNYGIILMHQGVEKTIDALPEIIDTLRSRGYTFVTVSQLMKIEADISSLAQKNTKAILNGAN